MAVTVRTANQARPTIYRGTQMRSRTEAKAAAAYDRAGLTWLYEPLCYANARAQYLPDFVIADRVTVYDALGSTYWSGQSFWEIKWRHEEAEDAVARMAVIWDGSVRAPLIGWVPDSRKAWAALPCTVNMNGRPEGRMFEADVFQCAVHGVVVQSSLTRAMAGLPSGECFPCQLDGLPRLLAQIEKMDPSNTLRAKIDAGARALDDAIGVVDAIGREGSASHTELKRRAEELRALAAELVRNDVAVPDPTPPTGWQNNPIARRWLRPVCAP